MATAERVRELLSYDPSTGEFWWKVKTSNRVKARSVAGYERTNQDGKKYWLIRVDGKLHYAHRLAWLVTHGEFPPEQIDHIDGNGLNNRLENLRAVSHAENGRNLRKKSNNTSGVSGVSWHKSRQKWAAQIQVNRKHIHLGLFANKDEAIAARRAAEAEYGFHENHGTDRPL